MSQLHPQGDPPLSMTRPMYATAFLSATMHPVPYNPVHECFTGADFYPCSAGEWSVTKNLRQVCMFSDWASWRRQGVKSTCGIYRLPSLNGNPHSTIFIYTSNIIQIVLPQPLNIQFCIQIPLHIFRTIMIKIAYPLILLIFPLMIC